MRHMSSYHETVHFGLNTVSIEKSRKVKKYSLELKHEQKKQLAFYSVCVLNSTRSLGWHLILPFSLMTFNCFSFAIYKHIYFMSYFECKFMFLNLEMRYCNF
jgi:hypothetical protein